MLAAVIEGLVLEPVAVPLAPPGVVADSIVVDVETGVTTTVPFVYTGGTTTAVVAGAVVVMTDVDTVGGEVELGLRAVVVLALATTVTVVLALEVEAPEVVLETAVVELGAWPPVREKLGVS